MGYFNFWNERRAMRRALDYRLICALDLVSAYYLSLGDLARMTGAHVADVLAEMTELVRLGVAEERQVPGERHYRITDEGRGLFARCCATYFL